MTDTSDPTPEIPSEPSFKSLAGNGLSNAQIVEFQKFADAWMRMPVYKRDQRRRSTKGRVIPSDQYAAQRKEKPFSKRDLHRLKIKLKKEGLL